MFKFLGQSLHNRNFPFHPDFGTGIGRANSLHRTTQFLESQTLGSLNFQLIKWGKCGPKFWMEEIYFAYQQTRQV